MKMTKTEIENKIYDLKRVIESCKNIIKANENEIKKLEAEKEKPAFERVSKDRTYYLVGDVRGKIIAHNVFDDYSDLHRARFDNNNYFLNKERAEEVADKINFLLKLERLHDTFCPDYKPDWNDIKESKWAVVFNYDENRYTPFWNAVTDNRTVVYFDSKENAEKVCKILNNKIKNN